MRVQILSHNGMNFACNDWYLVKLENYYICVEYTQIPQYLIQNFKNSNGHIISIGFTSFVKYMTFMALVFKLHLSWNNNIEKMLKQQKPSFLSWQKIIRYCIYFIDKITNHMFVQNKTYGSDLRQMIGNMWEKWKCSIVDIYKDRIILFDCLPWFWSQTFPHEKFLSSN